MSVPGTIQEIAKRYNISSKTVINRVKEHPELGIVFEKRRTTMISDTQAQQLCHILDERYGRKTAVPDAGEPEGEAARDFSTLLEEYRLLSQSFSELETENAQLRTDIAVERVRNEERSERMAFLEDLNKKIPRLEAAAEERQREIGDLRAEVAEARAEVAAARDEWKSKGLLDRLFRR